MTNQLVRVLKEKFLARFLKATEGATAIEYGLIAALVSVVIVAALKALGTSLINTFNTVNNNL